MTSSPAEGRLLGRIKRALGPEVPAPTPKEYVCPRKCIDVERIPSHSALIVGAKGAGKSHYIASLPLAQQPGWFGFEQRSLDWIGGTEFSEDRVVIDPTQAIGEHFQPRVVTGKPAREGTQRHYGLYVGTLAIGDDPRDWQSAWLIDMPGEMFRPEYAALLNNAFSVDVADLIIACVDLSVPRRAILTTSTLLSISDLHGGNGHLAVVGTKADELWNTVGFPEELQKVPAYPESPTDTANRLSNQSALAAEWMSRQPRFQSIPKVAKSFSSASFHLVSATSCAPVDNVFPFVEPLRVLEPFMYEYLLSKGLLEP
jgi:hypothetical protein